MSLLKTINELGPDNTRLVLSETYNGEALTVREYQGYRWLSSGGEMIQSLMDINHPEQLLLPNLQAMLAVLSFTDSPATLLNLGAGAGTLQRHLAAGFPGLQLTSVEPNRAIIDVAVNYFQMQHADYVIDTAEDFLEKNTQQYDVILVDIYSAERQPDCLYQAAFHDYLAKACSDTGVLAFNLLPESEEDLLGILRPLIEHVAWLLLHEVPNHDNVIIYALRDKNLSASSLMPRIEQLLAKDIKTEIIAQNA